MKIIELVCKPNGSSIPQIYTVGNAPLNVLGVPMDNMGMVASIRYNRLPYNKGFQGDYPSYTVEFEDSDIRSIIPESDVIRVGIDIEKNKKDDEAAPELPE